MSHSGSNTRALVVAPRSAFEHCGSSRVQLVIEDVVGTPESVFFALGSTTVGIGNRRTVRVSWTVVTAPNAPDARTVMRVSPAGSQSAALHCDQLPGAMGVASVNGPFPI